MSELTELDTLRIRTGEMAAEIDRLQGELDTAKREYVGAIASWENAETRCKQLQAVIDEARKQEPVYWMSEINGIIDPSVSIADLQWLAGHNQVRSVPFFAAPIPAQVAVPTNIQNLNWNDAKVCSPESGKEILVTDGKNIELAYGYAIFGGAIGDRSGSPLKKVKKITGWIYQDELFAALLDQSPRITEQDTNEIFESVVTYLEYNAPPSFEQWNDCAGSHLRAKLNGINHA